MRLSRVAALLALAASACAAPSPEELRLVPQAGVLEESSAKLLEGDLLVLDVEPMRGDERMNLCVEASTAGSSAATVRRVRGRCRRFVVMATRAGLERVRFVARDATTELTVEVARAP